MLRGLYSKHVINIQNRRKISSFRRNSSLRPLERNSKCPFANRSELRDARRIVVKLGSAVVTREDQSGVPLGRLASIVEQISQLQNEGKEMLLVTSGAVAFGKQKLRAEIRMSMSMRETLSPKATLQQGILTGRFTETRAAAAVGQRCLMSLYDIMFQQNGINIAQVLVTKPDFYNPESQFNLKCTLQELLRLNILPIVNTNDAIVPPTDFDFMKLKQLKHNSESIHIKDNDSLSAHLAAEVDADLLILMSDVDGIYTLPPGEDGARLLHTYCPFINGNITFGEKSSVGLGGMESKVKAATWALERGISVVICNGKAEQSISQILQGRRVGTFFTNHKSSVVPIETVAAEAKKGSGTLQQLTNEQRSEIVLQIADFLKNRKNIILEENKKDLEKAKASGLEAALMARLTLTNSKLDSLAEGLTQIANSSNVLGRVLKRTRVAEGMELKQIFAPIGVLLVIFESRPDCLPQVAALSIITGNGLLLKGGREAHHTNMCLFKLVEEALSMHGASNAIALVNSREEVSELLQLDEYIDLIVPRGSSQLVRFIQQQSKGIPVLGHSEGICHVYIDEHAQLDTALRIVKDSKCEYPSACNAMETLLIHRNLINENIFVELCSTLQKENVTMYSGPRLHSLLTFGPPAAKSMKVEYGNLNCAIEVVDSVEGAIDHINTHGSHHTDAIVTENVNAAKRFLSAVDSACVFHNCSTRFADGYRFGLGAEIGISTSRIHARGPVGIEGLLTTKWVLEGSGNTVQDFSSEGNMKYCHEPLPAVN